MTNMETLSQFYDIAIPHPSRPWSLEDTEYLLSVKGQWDLLDLLTLPEDQLNFKTLTLQERNYKALSSTLMIYFPRAWRFNNLLSRIHGIISTITERIIPVVASQVQEYIRGAEQKQGRWYGFLRWKRSIFHAATTIRSIRESHKSGIPIEIFYINNNDHSEIKRQYFQTEFTNVKTVDLSQYIDDTWTKLEGWA